MEKIRKPATSTSNGGEIDSAVGTKVTLWDSTSKLAGIDQTLGLYKAGVAPGQTSGTAIASGYIGEKMEAVSGAINLTGNGQYTDLASITLTQGVWIINAVCIGSLNTGTGMTVFYGALGTSPGNVSGGAQQGSTQFDGPPPTAAYNVSISIPGVHVNTGTSVTYYLKGLASYSGGQPTARGRITAIRIA
jgi:hypothetical protein